MERIRRPDLHISGERFETIDEMYRVCESRALRPYYSSDRSAKKARDVHDGKSVSYSWEETRRDMMFGSDLFDEDFADVKSEVDSEVKDLRASVERSGVKKDVVGQSVCVERALAGHPKAFNRRTVVRRKQKTVHFLYNISCSWSTTTRERLKSGCILMAIADTMERMGYQTAITYTPYFAYGCDGEDSLVAEVCIKDYKTRFNPKKMQFPLAAESVLFQLGCWWMHRCPEGESDWGEGEGRSVDYSSSRMNDAKRYAREKRAIYMSTPMMVREFGLDVNKAFKYVFEELEKM